MEAPFSSTSAPIVIPKAFVQLASYFFLAQWEGLRSQASWNVGCNHRNTLWFLLCRELGSAVGLSLASLGRELERPQAQAGKGDINNPNSLCVSPKNLGAFHQFSGEVLLLGVYQRSCFGLSYLHLKCTECCSRNRPFWKLPLNHLLFLLLCAGRKGGHKGRARQYTSPEEIDAQLQAEKQKARVCLLLCVLSVLIPALSSLAVLCSGAMAAEPSAADHSSTDHSMDPKYLQLGRLQSVTQSGSWGFHSSSGDLFSPYFIIPVSSVSSFVLHLGFGEQGPHFDMLLYVEITVFALFLL